jgi:hypothetical protein
MARYLGMFVLFISAAWLGTAVAEDDDAIADLKNAVTIGLVQALRTEVTSSLRESGMSESDAERIAFEFSSDLTECVYGALTQSLERRALSISDIPPDTKPQELGALFRDEAEFEELVKTCFYSAFEKAGLSDD